MKAYWKNPDGYRLVKDCSRSTWWTAIYEFTLPRDTSKRLTFVDEDGTEYQPDKHMFTDLGSIPRWPPGFRFLVPVDRFLAFLIHDPGYALGGLFVSGAFRPMTRSQVDGLLYRGMLVDPIPPWRATAYGVWAHVRAFGRFSWLKGDKRLEYPSYPRLKRLKLT